ncbi:MAG: ArnT family glycosyltransferase, partial [Planctomycetota bacterium]
MGAPPLWDANEPLYAEPPKEVLTWPEGDFLAPTWNGRTFFAHPPLATWITVPFYQWLGPSEFGHRLPMALAASLTVLAVYVLGKRKGGMRTGILAALVLAATPRVWLFSRQLSGDVYMTTLLTWAFVLAEPAVAGRGWSWRTWTAHALVGIGFLAKGPVILVLYGGAFLLAWLGARPRAPLRRLRPLRSVLVVLALGAPWFVYMALRFPAFLGEHFGRFTLERIVGGLGHRGVGFYPVALLGDAQPWILLLPFALLLAWRSGRRRVVDLLPWTVIAWTLLAFTFSAGKRNVYLLPLYPMLAVVVAPVLAAAWAGRSPRLARVAGGLLALLALAGTVGLAILESHEP